MNRSIVLCVGLCLLGCSRSQAPNQAAPSEEATAVSAGTGTVTVEIVESEKTRRIHLMDVAPGTTLEQVMRSIDEVPITITGSGATAFVDQIGDQATAAGQGWTFDVDGQHANQGVGATILTPPTTVSWRYGEEPE